MRAAAYTMMSLAILAASVSPLGAQEPNPPARTLQEEVARLNLTMERIVALLEKQVESQETSLLIKRMELSSAALVSKRETLRKARARVLDLEDEEAQLTRIFEVMEEGQDRIEENSGEEAAAHELMQLEQMEARLKSVQRRRQDLAREIVELENEVMSLEEDAQILEDVLDERLGLR